MPVFRQLTPNPNITATLSTDLHYEPQLDSVCYFLRFSASSYCRDLDLRGPMVRK